jgi:hypothetical protein
LEELPATVIGASTGFGLAFTVLLLEDETQSVAAVIELFGRVFLTGSFQVSGSCLLLAGGSEAIIAAGLLLRNWFEGFVSPLSVGADLPASASCMSLSRCSTPVSGFFGGCAGVGGQ